VAIIGGTGDQGFGLALRWARAGQRIIIGSRVRARAEEAAARAISQLGGGARVEGMENPAAAAAAPFVVLTVPFEAQIATLKSLQSAMKPGQVLVDVTVPLEAGVGGSPSRVLGVWAGSAAEQAAENAPKGVRVAAAFHNVSAEALQHLDSPVDCDVLVCGQDAETRQAVRPWVERIPGCNFVDGGPLANARTIEALTALLIGINRRYKTSHAGIRITGLDSAPPKK